MLKLSVAVCTEWEFTKFRPPRTYDARNTVGKIKARRRRRRRSKKPAGEVKHFYIN